MEDYGRKCVIVKEKMKKGGKCKKEAAEKEESGYADRLYLACSEMGGAEAEAMQGRIVGRTIEGMLKSRGEDGASMLERISAKYLMGLLREDKEITTKDMLGLQKLMGEDVQRNQSVSVKINAEAKAVKSTDEFLSGIVEGKKDGEA